MPALNGLEMMRCIRAINPGVKTIYVSGAGEQFRTALEMEEQDFGAIFLNKPFTGKDLIRVMSDGATDTTRGHGAF
jgi:YesN/AraC family two-component response regulator